MKRNESQKKENNSEEKWYARMNALEVLWRTRMAENRLEYLEKFIQVSKNRSDFELPRR